MFQHQVMNGSSTPAESHNADSLGVTLLLQILQDCIELSKKQKGKSFKGNNQVVQWLRLSTSTARAQVQSPVRELRSSKLHGTTPHPRPAKKKKKGGGPLKASRAANANGYRALSAAVLGGSEMPTFRAVPSCPADE